MICMHICINVCTLPLPGVLCRNVFGKCGPIFCCCFSRSIWNKVQGAPLFMPCQTQSVILLCHSTYDSFNKTIAKGWHVVLVCKSTIIVLANERNNNNNKSYWQIETHLNVWNSKTKKKNVIKIINYLTECKLWVCVCVYVDLYIGNKTHTHVCKRMCVWCVDMCRKRGFHRTMENCNKKRYKTMDVIKNYPQIWCETLPRDRTCERVGYK